MKNMKTTLKKILIIFIFVIGDIALFAFLAIGAFYITKGSSTEIPGETTEQTTLLPYFEITEQTTFFPYFEITEQTTFEPHTAIYTDSPSPLVNFIRGKVREGRKDINASVTYQ